MEKVNKYDINIDVTLTWGFRSILLLESYCHFPTFDDAIVKSLNSCSKILLRTVQMITRMKRNAFSKYDKSDNCKCLPLRNA